MAAYQLTNQAAVDIERLYEYSIVQFGLQVARDYLTGLHACFELLSEHQSFGNDYGFIKPNLLRYEYRSHSVYYQPLEDGILIVRLLGSKQNPMLHL